MGASVIDLWPAETLEATHEATVHLLGVVGLRVDSPNAREALLTAGCVEGGAEGGSGRTASKAPRILFPWPVVEESLASHPPTYTLVARDPAHDVAVSGDPQRTVVHCFGEAPFASDPRSGETRRATVRDQALAARIAHRLRYPQILNPIFSPHEVPGELQPLVSYFVLAAESDKYIGGPGVSTAAQVRAIWELANHVVDASPGDGRYPVQLSFSPVSPLALGAEVGEALMEAARLGVVCELLSCPVAGTTAPASLAGALAQQSAEILALNVLTQAVAPGSPCIYGARLVACDPRTAAFAAGGPELGYCAVGAAALARRYGLPSDVYGLATDSKVLDAQCVMERTVNAMLGALGRPAFLSGPGLTQSGLAGSVLTLPLDDEILRRVSWALGPPVPAMEHLDLTELATGALSEVGFLGTRQARRAMHEEYYVPRLTFRGGLEEWTDAGGRDLLDAAAQQAEELGAAEPLGLPDDVMRAMAEVVRRAAADVGADLDDVRELWQTAAGV